MMELKIKALSDKVGRDFPAPHYATDGAAAMDLCACLDEPVTLQPGETRHLTVSVNADVRNMTLSVDGWNAKVAAKAVK